MKIIKLQTALVLLFIIGLSACGGGGSGTDSENRTPPVIPDMTKLSEKISPDLSFFKNNNPQKQRMAKAGTYSNFYIAKSLTMSGSFLFGLGQTYGLYFNLASSEDAHFKDGQWVWDFTSKYGSYSATYRMTAKDLGNKIQWTIFWTYDTPEFNLTNYKMMEGSITKDGSQGSWTFNTLAPNSNEEIPFITSTWSIPSDTKRELTLEIFDDGGALEGTTVFTQNGADYNMTITGSDDIVITWNDNTNKGSVTEDGSKKCWGANFQNVPCS